MISAVPFYSFNKLFNIQNIDKIKTPEYKYSSILTVHIWLKENCFKEKYYGLIDSDVHWIFNHQNHITIVISNADKFMDMSKNDIEDLVVTEISKYFKTFNKSNIYHSRVIKEKRATYIPENGVMNQRPQSGTEISNLFLAGDWINTGLPATIRWIKSGKIASQLIQSFQ